LKYGNIESEGREMEITMVVGKRGIITIPSKIREELQIVEGDAIKVSVINQDELKIKIIRG
jgi:AbrB family looped-hinge helix DNA binding protein